MVGGLTRSPDIVLCHGVLVLAESGFESLCVWMKDTVGLLLDMHPPKVVVEGVSIRAAGEEGQKYQKIVQKSLATEEMGFFHCWYQKWPLYPYKALSTPFFDSSLDSLVRNTEISYSYPQ
uniref:Uncharacterized protein n=1 Tax=Lepeophtheirus salmonis TaxID=72036 RepID=A0A0K2VI71_LEPSM